MSDVTMDSAQQAIARRRIVPRTLVSRQTGLHLVILAGYLAAGVAETWPRVTQVFNGHVPGTTDAASYVWAFWWVAHQVAHLHNPWFTSYMGAPAGMQLGFDTLMPLPGVLMAPLTLAFGPGPSFAFMVAVVPGLLCYVMYRVARLWVTSALSAVAAGALFGLSTMLTWEDLFHLNIAVGALFLPMALEASVRLRRDPGPRHAVILGVVVGGVVLVNQESAILVLILTAAAVLPWLLGPPRAGKLRLIALAALTGMVVATPQIIAMAQQAMAGGATVPAATMAGWDRLFGVPLATPFTPSPRVGNFGLTELAKLYQYHQPGEGRPTFGFILSVLAVVGLVVAWRRRSARLLALLWLGSAALALGTVLVIGGRTFVPVAQVWHGIVVSDVMPYTWFVRVPGLSSFREADRLELLGMVPAALLAGSAVDWLLTRHRVVLAVVLAMAVLEAGWYSPGEGIPVALPALDGPIAAGHSGSIVVDIPFGLRGGVPDYGSPMIPESLVLATDDGHPRAISYTSWVPANTVAAIKKHPFYLDLVAVQDGQRVPAAQLTAARADARRMKVDWVLVWKWYPGLASYLNATGFRFGYRADHVTVYRPGPPG